MTREIIDYCTINPSRNLSRTLYYGYSENDDCFLSEYHKHELIYPVYNMRSDYPDGVVIVGTKHVDKEGDTPPYYGWMPVNKKDIILLRDQCLASRINYMIRRGELTC
jgi:hypothetical protein